MSSIVFYCALLFYCAQYKIPCYWLLVSCNHHQRSDRNHYGNENLHQVSFCILRQKRSISEAQFVSTGFFWSQCSNLVFYICVKIVENFISIKGHCVKLKKSSPPRARKIPKHADHLILGERKEILFLLEICNIAGHNLECTLIYFCSLFLCPSDNFPPSPRKLNGQF